ncbi:hypothetical protein CO657_11690 [Rhizobium acidisoli]|uniref:Uncharacterized protein n=1 Tax=Rhizobium acidisoli TaxID=1538158 RepID=A0AAE5TY47_9HYPH|nr:hypothetical protein CO657_11690 [Rhizobium acidisoli]
MPVRHSKCARRAEARAGYGDRSRRGLPAFYSSSLFYSGIICQTIAISRIFRQLIAQYVAYRCKH